MLVARHGDVMFYKVNKNSLKTNLTGSKKVKKELTVALGEMTGHHHTIYPTKGSSLNVLSQEDTKEVKPEDDFIYFTVEGAPVIVSHQEHDAEVLTPTKEDEVYYRVIQDEYQPFENTIQRVAD